MDEKFQNCPFRLKYLPIPTKKSNNTRQNLDLNCKNVQLKLKYGPIPAKKPYNTRQNSDIKLKKMYISIKISANSGQKIDKYRTKFGRQTEK